MATNYIVFLAATINLDWPAEFSEGTVKEKSTSAGSVWRLFAFQGMSHSVKYS